MFLRKIKDINNEYMDLSDNRTVQLKDFGIMMKDLKVDKFTQNIQILKMKLWLHIEEMFKQSKMSENVGCRHHIVDICFSLYKEHDI